MDSWDHLVTARQRALSCAASRARRENAHMIVYRQPDDPVTCYVQPASLPLPKGAEILDTLCAPGQLSEVRS